ncbi:MAG: hypothetical protein GXO69_09005 [Acidobacteria bacterium]|nr:hypothetical protein [Acidobacteriota bacterium]
MSPELSRLETKNTMPLTHAGQFSGFGRRNIRIFGKRPRPVRGNWFLSGTMKGGFRKIAVRTGLLCFLLLAVLPAWGQEMLINGGFESGENGWTGYVSGEECSFSVVSKDVFTGARSAQLIVGQGKESNTAAFYQIISVEPGRHLHFSYAIKTSDVSFWTSAFFQWLDKDGKMVLEQDFFPSTGTTAWRTYASRLTVPPEVHGLIVFLILTGKNGTAWFDSVSLIPETDNSPAEFSVNAAENIGTVQPFLSTNAGPISLRSRVNLVSKFKTMGIHSVRTHDYHGPCDIHGIFPDWSLPADDPASYHFDTTDQIIGAITASGAEVFFRLGESYESEPVHNAPPPDLDIWAEVCRHIVLHYNYGWDNGFYYNIRHWEIWNEPDVREFWTGTALQYAKLYDKAARAIKACDATLQVGGPAVANLASTAFLHTFLSYVKDHKTPLDFFSYHYYGTSNPFYYYQMNRDAEELLSGYGIKGVDLYLSEWNTWRYDPANRLDMGRDDPLSAASAAAVITCLQNAGLTDAFRYRSDEYYFGLFHDDGSISWSGLVFQALANFRTTPILVPASGGDKLGRTILAGKSADGEEAAVLISDTASAAAGYVLHLTGLKTDSCYYYFQYRIDAFHRLEQVGSGILNNNMTISGSVSTPYVELLLLYREKSFRLPRPVRKTPPLPLFSF